MELHGVDRLQRWTNQRLRELPGRNRLRFDLTLGRYVIERHVSAGCWETVASFASIAMVAEWLEQIDRGQHNGRRHPIIDTM